MYNLREVTNLAELFKPCKYLSPLNVVCVLKIITFRFTLKYYFSFYNSFTFRFGGLTDKLKNLRHKHKKRLYPMDTVPLNTKLKNCYLLCLAAATIIMMLMLCISKKHPNILLL